MCSDVGVLKYPPVVNWRDASGPIPQDRNNFRIPPRTTTPVQTGNGPSVPLIIIWSQKIEGPRRTIIPQEVRNTEPLNAPINIITSKHTGTTPTWSKVIHSKAFTKESRTNVYTRIQMNFARDTVLSKSPNFMDLGLSSINTTDELGSVFASTTRIGSAMHGPGWLLHSHCIIEAIANRASGTKAKNHYNVKSEYENRRD